MALEMEAHDLSLLILSNFDGECICVCVCSCIWYDYICMYYKICFRTYKDYMLVTYLRVRVGKIIETFNRILGKLSRGQQLEGELELDL